MRIVVAGDGIAAHLAAAMLARVAQVVRVPVGAGGHGLGPVGEAVIGSPAWVATATARAMGEVPGAVSALGIAFAGWSPEPWFLPFGEIGAPLEDVPFPQLAARLRAEGHALRFGDYALAAMAAQAGRFAPPSPDPRSPLSALRPGMSYPADALSRRLEEMGRAAGVTTSAPLAHPMEGERLRLADGTGLDADLFVDASGGAAGVAAGGWDGWQAWLPCARVVSRRIADDRPPPPYPLHIATPAGWRAVTALDGGRVETDYTAAGDGDRYDNGCRHATWVGRRVAIGAAAALVEPLLGHALHLAHDAIERLVGLLPAPGSDARAEAAEYHRLTVQQHARARDAAVALWASAGRPAAAPGAELARKLALYRHRGHLPLEDGEVLSRDEWAALLDGQGVRQRRVDPLAAALPAMALTAHMRRLREHLVAAVDAMPPYRGTPR